MHGIDEGDMEQAFETSFRTMGQRSAAYAKSLVPSLMKDAAAALGPMSLTAALSTSPASIFTKLRAFTESAQNANKMLVIGIDELNRLRPNLTAEGEPKDDFEKKKQVFLHRIWSLCSSPSRRRWDRRA